MTTLALTTLLAVSLAAVMHWWPLLSATWRRRLAIATNTAGLAFLVAAVRAEGLRELSLTSMVLVGPAYHTAVASASASLYYYVLTAVCLSLGFAGLALGEPLARWLAPRPVASCVLIAWLVTVVRLLLEKSAAPALLAQSVGVTPMAPVAGAYIALRLGQERGGWRPLLRALLVYAFLTRGFVALVGLLATYRGFGTHYDVSALTSVPLALTGSVYPFVPRSPEQVLWLVLVPQFVVWPLFTVIAGLLAGRLASRLWGQPRTTRPTAPTPGDAAAGRTGVAGASD